MQRLKRNLNRICIYIMIFINSIFSYPIKVLASSPDSLGESVNNNATGNGTVTVQVSKNFWDYYSAFYSEYKLYLNIFMACTMLLNIIILTYHITQLGLNATNPHKKQESIGNIAIASVCVALQGAVIVAMWVLYFLSNPLATGAAQ